MEGRGPSVLNKRPVHHGEGHIAREGGNEAKPEPRDAGPAFAGDLLAPNLPECCSVRIRGEHCYSRVQAVFCLLCM